MNERDVRDMTDQDIVNELRGYAQWAVGHTRGAM